MKHAFCGAPAEWEEHPAERTISVSEGGTFQMLKSLERIRNMIIHAFRLQKLIVIFLRGCNKLVNALSNSYQLH